jgi:hypothetical protein
VEIGAAVAPRVGAWIETAAAYSATIMDIVPRPRAGPWIETFAKDLKILSWMSRALRGAWIEKYIVGILIRCIL